MDISSFHFEKESLLYIEAIEPSLILQIKKVDLIYLFKNHQKFNIIFRVIIEKQIYGIAKPGIAKHKFYCP